MWHCQLKKPLNLISLYILCLFVSFQIGSWKVHTRICVPAESLCVYAYMLWNTFSQKSWPTTLRESARRSPSLSCCNVTCKMLNALIIYRGKTHIKLPLPYFIWIIYILCSFSRSQTHIYTHAHRHLWRLMVMDCYTSWTVLPVMWRMCAPINYTVISLFK